MMKKWLYVLQQVLNDKWTLKMQVQVGAPA